MASESSGHHPLGGHPSIGRLPIPFIQASNIVEDDELELLERQLAYSQPQSREVLVGPGRFSARDRNHFATYPRRRRCHRTLMTLWSNRGLLDEGQTEQTRLMLNNVIHWDFNAFTLDRLSNGHNLATLCTHLFHVNGLIQHYRLDALVVWKFFDLVEQGYHASNPYHNGVHASDVTQAMHCFLQEEEIKRHLTPLEFLGAILAASCHDLDHPGKNEKFLIATGSHLAGLYDNSSVLENHHWRSAISCLWESGLAQALPESEREQLHDIVRDIILATDISRQHEFLQQLSGQLDEGGVDLRVPERRHFILQIAMKCADISNPCRTWNISRLWSYRACEEFFRQGDRERELGFAVTPFCDRFNMSVPKVQSGFYRAIASPLFDEWNRFLSSPLSNSMLHNLTTNQARWDLLAQSESRSIMVESAASQTSTSSSSGGGSHPNDSRRESLDPPPSHHRLSRSSAEGDDDSDCSSYPYLPLESSDTLNFTRRHSLPLSETRTPNSSRFGAPSRTSSEDSAQEDANPPQPGTLHRQYSLVERRRLVRQAGEQQHQHQQLATYASHRLANKRKLFASTRSPCHTVESVSAGSSFEQDPDVSHRVHFSFGPHEEDESNQTLGEEDGKLEPQRISRLIEEEKENLANSGRSDRRCSAPSTLLISQLGARSFSSSSRENSPTSSAIKLRATNNSKSSSGPNAASSFISRRLNLGQRRGSLPADLLDQQMMMISQPQNQQQPQQSCYHPSTSSSINPFLIGQRSSSCGRPGSGQDNKKKQRKKILRRRSGGAELTLTSSSSSPHRLNELGESTSVSPGSWSLSSASTSSSTGGGGGHQYRRAAHRHHQNRLNSRRGSAPMGMLFFSADSGLPSLSGKCGFYSKAAAGSGNHNPNNNNNNILRELQAVSRKVQVLRSGLSPSLEKEILENVHSSLAVLNGRRGSLPTDLNMMPSFVKS